jgi:hypothetical protein
MKLFFLSGIAFLSTVISLSAQEKINTITTADGFKFEQSAGRPNYFLSVGLNVLDNGNSKLPFNADEMSFKVPFFASIERRGATSNFSGVLSFSTNRLKVNSVDKFYYSIDAAARYYFDDYIFKNKDIETYAGLGLGRFFLENNGNNSLSFIGGARYWFSNQFAVSLQGNAKVGLKPKNADVLNKFVYNLGIVWKSNKKNKVSSIKTSIALKESLMKDKEAVVVTNDDEEMAIENEVTELPLEALDSALKRVDLPMDPLTPLDYSGDWNIKITNSKNKTLIIKSSLYSTYAPYVSDGTMWISDFKKGVWLQCKIEVNLEKGTFTAIKQPNTVDKGTVTITEGKFEKRKGILKAGNTLDKIYFKAEFSYDPGSILIFEGHKSTGLKEDKQ